MINRIRRSYWRVGRVDAELVRRSGELPPTPFDTLCRRAGRAADHSRLWFAVAAVLVARRGATRRAGLRGIAAIAGASMSASLVGKHLFPRRRPAAELLPVPRRNTRRPTSSSFPSGHAASAFAFASAVTMEHRAAGALVFPVAALVGYSRVHTGVHWPSDVAAGAAIGVGAACATRHWWPHGTGLPKRGEPPVDAPDVGAGDGLLVLVNPASGTDGVDPTAEILAFWPKAELVRVEPGTDPRTELTERLTAGGVRALGAAGGDGTVTRVADLAVRFGLPLVVIPAGTLDHFARDLGDTGMYDTADATQVGAAIRVDIADVTVEGRRGTDRIRFVNTASLGGYPEMVRLREKLEVRWPKWLAAALAMSRALRRAQPLPILLDGRRELVWMLFVGNGSYEPKGFGAARRASLASGTLDVRYLRADLPYSRVRFVLAALTGTLQTSHVYRHFEAPTTEIRLLAGERRIATDGEVGPLGRRFAFAVHPGALTAYRHPKT
ncbi:bifunctional phosphatase PAP2/diacylglycerol kinase family protein [Actinophytocola gossypii]|uniref:Phosphatase PAP2 family protein n=1 Tax=Actinophytocola gossypii TaxID=2812003 RepID=A0ABT2JA47_9PSEU|nr:bifunctional phosphatase PAP2/diacylglycerol kinase family protein [Actinophytocola gossypii]MCT2584736.1 phosphatase PAP2 family protein [Actinophytocola gossypii]